MEKIKLLPLVVVDSELFEKADKYSEFINKLYSPNYTVGESDLEREDIMEVVNYMSNFIPANSIKDMINDTARIQTLLASLSVKAYRNNTFFNMLKDIRHRSALIKQIVESYVNKSLDNVISNNDIDIKDVTGFMTGVYSYTKDKTIYKKLDGFYIVKDDNKLLLRLLELVNSKKIDNDLKNASGLFIVLKYIIELSIKYKHDIVYGNNPCPVDIVDVIDVLTDYSVCRA